MAEHKTIIDLTHEITTGDQETSEEIVVQDVEEFKIPSDKIFRKQLVISEEAREEYVKKRLPKYYNLRKIPDLVLDEDDYVNTLNTIIQRDYFPDLPRLRALRDLGNAVKSKDSLLIESCRDRLTNLTPVTNMGTPVSVSSSGRPTSTCKDNETPLSMFSDSRRSDISNRSSDLVQESSAVSRTGNRKVRDLRRLALTNGKDVILDISSMSVDSFQSKFTSEDNASFEKILEKQVEDLYRKEWWIEDAALHHNMNSLESRLAMEDNRVTNKIAYNEVDPRSNLFFPARGLPDDSQSIIKDLEVRQTMRRNTRFSTKLQSSDDQLRLALAKREGLNIKADTYSKLDKMIERGNFDKDSKIRRNELVTPASQSDSPVVHGYGIVHTPSLKPGINVTPIMTWGEVGATPVLLTDNGDPVDGASSVLLDEVHSGALCGRIDNSHLPHTFDIPDMDSREKAAHRLADGCLNKNSKKKKLTGSRKKEMLLRRLRS